MIVARVRPAGDSAGARHAFGGILVVLLTLALPGAARAETGQVKLALLPVGQPGSFFDLTMAPGSHRTLEIEIGNDGDAALAVRTYAADVYTIVNGGFGARLRDEPATGTTRWLTYPSTVLTLDAGQRTRRSFTVDVPSSTEPGEYIASLVLENDRPIPGVGTVSLDQIVRQAVAVVVTVPGARSPALAIGAASHRIVAGKSVVAVAVENTGNVRLLPVAEFTLLDAAGAEVSRATLPMGTSYAGTPTSVEVPLAALLEPGTYQVRLVMADAGQALRVEAEVPLVVEAPAAAVVPGGIVPGLTGVNQGAAASGTLLLGGAALGVALLLAGLFAGRVVVLRRRRSAYP